MTLEYMCKLKVLLFSLSLPYLTFMRSLSGVHLLDVSIKVVWPAKNIHKHTHSYTYTLVAQNISYAHAVQ